MKISIIGSGEVGSRIGKEFVDYGHDVLFSDKSEKIRFKILEEGIALFEEYNDINKKYKITENNVYAVENSDISFMALPTPLNDEWKNNHQADIYDYSYLRNAAKECGKALKEKDDYHIFVLKSTVTPGSTEEVLIPALEKSSGKKVDEDFGVVYNPEFLTVIQNTWTDDKEFKITPDKEGRIVLGSSDKKSLNTVKELYSHSNLEIYETDFKTAEYTKLYANSRLPLAISFTNQMYLLNKLHQMNGNDIDFASAIEMAHKDHRIGKYGSVFGKAWGGLCFTKDTEAFIRWFKKEYGDVPGFLKESKRINDIMRKEYGVRE